MAVKKRKKSRFEFLTRKFPLRMQRKLVMLFMAVVLAFVVLIGRITYINVTKGSKYTKVVLDQQNYDSRVIAFKRGDIVDRNGTKMATSERVYNVILDVAVMMDKKEYIEPTKEVLKECFNVEGVPECPEFYLLSASASDNLPHKSPVHEYADRFCLILFHILYSLSTSPILLFPVFSSNGSFSPDAGFLPVLLPGYTSSLWSRKLSSLPHHLSHSQTPPA